MYRRISSCKASLGTFWGGAAFLFLLPCFQPLLFILLFKSQLSFPWFQQKGSQLYQHQASHRSGPCLWGCVGIQLGSYSHFTSFGIYIHLGRWTSLAAGPGWCWIHSLWNGNFPACMHVHALFIWVCRQARNIYFCAATSASEDKYKIKQIAPIRIDKSGSPEQ